jgi:ribulose-phosphate 3-epimerase
VPNISFGPLVVRALRPLADEYGAILDAHLMIVEPDRYVAEFAAAGADIITVHAEACVHLHRTLQTIRELGKRSGVALNPASPLNLLEESLPELDLALIMTVNPGFGGQQLIPRCLDKVTRLRTLRDVHGHTWPIQVDGGINRTTIAQAHAAGADVAVVGSAVFTPNQSVAAAVAALQAAL